MWFSHQQGCLRPFFESGWRLTRFESPGGDRVTGLVGSAWFVALLGVWNSMRLCMVVSVGVLVAGVHVSVWWLWVSRVFVTVLFENCIVDASIFFFDAIL